MSEAKSYSKERQLARGRRRYHRKVASPKRWQQIIDAKGDVCRICIWINENPREAALLGVSLEDCEPIISYHHLVDRVHGGSDTEANVLPLGGSGTTGHHGLVTDRDLAACAALRRCLTDAEYSYAVQKMGEGAFEARYPVYYGKAA